MALSFANHAAKMASRKMEFPQIILALIVAIGVVWFLVGSRSPSRKRAVGQELAKTSSEMKRVRLTEQQIIALNSASFTSPIYGENPSLMHAQMPNGASCFNIRTIESLVKRGFLKSDGRGGFLLTPEGEIGLRSGMGF